MECIRRTNINISSNGLIESNVVCQKAIYSSEYSIDCEYYEALNESHGYCKFKHGLDCCCHPSVVIDELTKLKDKAIGLISQDILKKSIDYKSYLKK